ncbi:helix-turn-helix transcriptional regulator [Saccharopolyspora sp. NPDC000359]|uniref:helix-turn-helix domain-containing protein n=1 Tax=Saccharopolyspora sp. NPDC000359 TaxID=3154251 RepID=UPI00332217DD
MTDARHELATVLRGLRQDAELSTTALAKQLGWSQSRVSRVERGAALPKPPDVEAWCAAVRADPDLRRHLMEIAGQLSAQLTEWRRELAPGRRRKQAEIRELEAAASVIRVFSSDVIPGLAQTGPYAKAMFQLGRSDVTSADEDVDAVVEARLARQEVLNTAGKRFELVMSEAALHRRLRRLLTAGEWRAQLDRLVDLARQPNVTLGAVPFDTTSPVEPHQYHAYAIIGDPDVDASAVVLAETVTRGLSIRSTGEITDYVQHCSALIHSAVTGDDLVAWLQEISTRDTSS